MAHAAKFDPFRTLFIRPLLWTTTAMYDFPSKIPSYAEKASRFAKGAIGRLIKCTLAETGGILVGDKIGRFIGGTLGEAAGSMVPVGKEIAGVALKTLGEEVGSFGGTIIGGYITLRLVDGSTLFRSKEAPEKSYSVATARFEIAGRTYDRIIVCPTHPLSFAIGIIPWKVTKMIVQAIAFNSHNVIPALKNCLKQRKITNATLLALSVQMACKNYSDTDGQKLAKTLTKSISDSFRGVLPNAVTSCAQTLLIPELQKGIEFMASHADLAAAIVVRLLHDYMKKIGSSAAIQVAHTLFQQASADEKAQCKHNLIQALDQEFGLPFPLLSLIGEATLSDKISSSLKPLFEKMARVEAQVIGIPFLGEEELAYLKEISSIYLQHYFIFLFANCQNVATDLTPEEEGIFYDDLIYLFFSGYASAVKIPILTNLLHAVTKTGVRVAHKIQVSASRLLAGPEQATFLGAPVVQQTHPNLAPRPEQQVRQKQNLVVRETYAPLKPVPEQQRHLKRGVVIDDQYKPAPFKEADMPRGGVPAQCAHLDGPIELRDDYTPPDLPKAAPPKIMPDAEDEFVVVAGPSPAPQTNGIATAANGGTENRRS